ncbi:hypothetical protein So717_05260 [Roseobacter cerasinus]|uniref:Uncharacterized protein n=1 Tax=Roseobacter cerasinus TaxID=2602289 RepID=A0A640VKD4_9RHOB|nr:hypothetical protein So717_05260 [Roseobacter cerasinus]
MGDPMRFDLLWAYLGKFAGARKGGLPRRTGTPTRQDRRLLSPPGDGLLKLFSHAPG